MLNRSSRARQGGLSLVEMMVGVAVGLIIVAAASLMVSAQLGDNRSLRLEMQLQQDMRATVDIITRELRRAGFWGAAQNGAWYEGGPAVLVNAYAPMSPASGPATQADFRYMRRPGDEGPFGFKLESGAIKSYMGTAWQELTDSRIMLVTAFSITSESPQTFQLSCPRLCADGTQDCWPSQTMRNLRVDITAQSRSDASVQRTLSARARVRNDWVQFNDPLNPTKICPD